MIHSMNLSGAENIKTRKTDMGGKGSKDKGKKEQRKKAKLNPKEKRKLKNEKKKATTSSSPLPK